MNKIWILLCLGCWSCHVSKKLSSGAEEHTEGNHSRELLNKSYLDSLFRAHLKISISYTKENFLPDTSSRPVPSKTTLIPSAKQPDKPIPVSREQITIDIQADVENRIQKSDSLSDKNATQWNEDRKYNSTQIKDRSVSWKFLIWFSLVLVLVAAAIYCMKKKINPFVKLLKLLRKWL